jgi:inorganic pyrophosphatase
MTHAARSGPTVTDEDFWSRLGSFVSEASVVVDRPRGSAHPRIPELIYPLDYGYLRNLRSGDGDGVDVWMGSRKRRVITGDLCTIDVGKRDAEVKILLGCTLAEQRRVLSLHNYGNQRAVLIRAEAVRRTASRQHAGKAKGSPTEAGGPRKPRRR